MLTGDAMGTAVRTAMEVGIRPWEVNTQNSDSKGSLGHMPNFRTQMHHKDANHNLNANKNKTATHFVDQSNSSLKSPPSENDETRVPVSLADNYDDALALVLAYLDARIGGAPIGTM
jgi:magnesium-transporting ATPase (P-type)